MSAEVLIPLVLGAVLGWVGGWAVSHAYYVQSGKAMATEAATQRARADALQKLVNTLGRVVEESGLIHVAQDAAGNITGAHFHRPASGAIPHSTAGDVTVTPAAAPAEPPPSPGPP